MSKRNANYSSFRAHNSSGGLYFAWPLLVWFCSSASLADPKGEELLAETKPRPGEDEAAFTINEPVYFTIGGHHDMTSKFQFSFKYRVFAEDGWVSNHASWLSGINFGYTQTSLWNLSANSLPFEDTSYRPSLFWETVNQREGAAPDFLRYGYEHESNGKAGDISRGINTLFLWPAWSTTFGGQRVVVGPKVYAYVSKSSENKDIHEYRGYADFVARVGNEDSWLVATEWRHGTGGYNRYQIDISYPIRERIFARTGGYLYVQLFSGYGETLLRYDQRKDLQARLGFAIVR